jgi:hypothetical protein
MKNSYLKLFALFTLLF